MRTFGTVRLVDALGRKQWAITCEPHVRVRLKRVFEKIPKGAHDTLTLSDTVEHASELLWFLDRYPMKVPQLKYLKARAREHQERASEIERILAAGYTPPAFAELALPPREYQRTAADLAMRTGRLLIADDLGLGKTCSAICTLADPANLPALVVTMTHLPAQWKREIGRFLPALNCHIVNKSKPYALDGAGEEGGQLALPGRAGTTFPDVVILNYHKLANWAEALAGRVKSTIFDECQELRIPDTGKYDAAKHIAGEARLRVGLSATPVYNMGGEIHAVLDVLAPGELGDRYEFEREWCKGDPYGSHRGAEVKDPKALGYYLREQGLMIRRTRAEVGRELPALQHIVHEVECDRQAIEKVGDSVAELARIILAKGGVDPFQKMRAAEEFSNALRQATGIAKCLAPGTRLIKFDGSVDAVENLRVGDVLMGPDSKPRRITATTRGRGPMFEVSSTSRIPLFAPYRVNGDHILALKHSGAIRRGDRNLFGQYAKGDRIEIPVAEYMKKSKHFRRLLKGYKADSIDFSPRPVPLDPYFFGLWLGDGSSGGAAVTTADPEIKSYLEALASRHGLHLYAHQAARKAPTYQVCFPGRGGNMRGDRARQRNPILGALHRIGVIGNKHIPVDYLVNAAEVRTAVLAGLIDSDGHRNATGGYTICTKWQHLAQQICRLAWSLGLAAKSVAIKAVNQTGRSFPAYRVSIFGRGLEQLPLLVPRKRGRARKQIKDALRSGIRVAPVGDGEFYGFSLEGDGLFLLEDYTVTHNSPYVAAFVKMILETGEPIVLAGWHREVYSIWLDLLKDYRPVMFTGSESAKAKEAAAAAFIAGRTKLLIMSLRSGAGLDGLQKVCRTVVVGELDWSPKVHDQLIGRVYRDGQADPCVAYFPVADSGSDPVVVDVLGMKAAQAHGINDPDAPLVIESNVDPDRVKRLAEDFLRRRGENGRAAA